jgi:hypothetical protein
MKTIYLFVIICLFYLIFANQIYSQNRLSGYEMLQTGYDYLYNNSALRIFDLVDFDGNGERDDPVMVGRQTLSSPGLSNVIFSYVKFGSVNSMVLFDSTSGGALSMQYCSDGPFADNILVLASSLNQLNWALVDINTLQVDYFSTNGAFAQYGSFYYSNDGIIWLSTTDLKIFKSTDLGLSFQQYTTIGENDPDFLQVIYPAELPIQASPNGQFLSIVGAFEGAYLTGNPDIVYRYFSIDFGVTWQGEVIGSGSGSNPEYGQISNRDYAPYFTNFGQCNSVVDDNGVTHVVFNGYGQGIIPGATDTTEVFPVLYWNSNFREWVAVTSIELESPDDGYGHSIADYYPFPAIGNAYPSIMVSSDGWRVIIVWTGPEFTGSGNTPYNIYPGDGGPNSAAVYYTDLYVAFSYNGGEEITGGIPAIATRYNNSEMYPICASRINIYSPNWQEQGTYVFFNDSIPGVSVFNAQRPGNGFAVGFWETGTEAFYFPSVEREDGFDNFTLSQNYPNPFNPNTKIQYAISSRQFVTIKIFDLLGNEIAVLVNEEKPTGKYEIEFSSHSGLSGIRELPSGVYFYQLKSGNLVQTKKMVLLK